MKHWPVGVLYSRSGMTSASEISQLQGTLLAIDEINAAGGVLGAPISPIIYDPQADPAQYATLAGRLIMNDGATNIFGCSASFSRKAVLPWIERRGGLLWYSVCYEGFEYSPNVIYTGPAPNQLHVHLAEFLFQNYGRRFFLVGSDYLFPRESNRIIRELLADVGGAILGEHYLPIDASASAFETVMAEAARQQPDVIFSTIVGPTTTLLYDAYAATTLDAKKTPIAALTTNEVHLAALAVEPSPGHIVCSPYFETLPTEANLRFVERYYNRFGRNRPADNCAESAYFTVHLFAKALARAGTLDPDRLRAEALGLDFDAPQGQVIIDPDNNHTYLRPRIGTVDHGRRFKILREADELLKPDPYLVDYVALQAVPG